jgi:hypothetical protein
VIARRTHDRALLACAGTVTIGLWATVEPATFTGTRYFSMAPGGKSPNVTLAGADGGL